jgi:Tol biopolymer transport system component
VRFAVVVSLAGCGRIGFGFGAADDASTPTTWSPFSPPQLVGMLSVDNVNWEPALSPDASLLAFNAQSITRGGGTLYLSRLQAGAWTTPAAIATSCDTGPAWAANATRFYCSGSIGTGDRLYVASFDGTTFGAPALVAGLENVDAASPTIAADELELFYTRLAPPFTVVGTGRATRATASDPWTDHGMVMELATVPGVSAWPSLSRDGSTIFVETDQATTSQIYSATRASRGTPFGPLVPTSEVDAVGNNGDPELSSDGTTLYFSSDRRVDSNHWDIYFAVRAKI